MNTFLKLILLTTTTQYNFIPKESPQEISESNVQVRLPWLTENYLKFNQYFRHSNIRTVRTPAFTPPFPILNPTPVHLNVSELEAENKCHSTLLRMYIFSNPRFNFSPRKGRSSFHCADTLRHCGGFSRAFPREPLHYAPGIRATLQRIHSRIRRSHDGCDELSG